MSKGYSFKFHKCTEIRNFCVQNFFFYTLKISDRTSGTPGRGKLAGSYRKTDEEIIKVVGEYIPREPLHEVTLSRKCLQGESV